MSLHLTLLSCIADHFAGAGKVIVGCLLGSTKIKPEASAVLEP